MSASQSTLSADRYGYDFVVATTQASINAVMKQFLAKLDEPVVTVCYVAGADGAPVRIGYQELIKDADGADPFSIPGDADPTADPEIKKLLAARFLMGFRAQLGLPPGLPPADVPDLVEVGSHTSEVTFNLLCSQFTVVELDPGGGYAQPSWLNQSQPTGSPWVFKAKVDLRMSTADPSAYRELPPAVRDRIHDLGETAFSVRQLLFDLDNAALESVPDIVGVQPGTSLYMALQQAFVGAYFAQLRADGQPLLGCAITQDRPLAASLTLTDLDAQVCPFVGGNGQPVADPTPEQRDLATLNFLCAADHHTLPPATTFGWNWIEPAEATDYHGVIAVNRNSFVNYLRSQLQDYVTDNCYLPYVRVSMKGIAVDFAWNMTAGQRPTVTTPATGTEVLAFHYANSAHDSEGMWGELRLSTSFDLGVDFSGDTITVRQHLVVYLDVRSLATEERGNVVDLTITDVYTLRITEDGGLGAVLSTIRQDNSRNPRTSDFLNFWTGLNSIIGAVRNWVRSVAPTSFTDIPLCVIQDYVFPGGRTFAFKSVAFSDNGDLVSHITYAKPS